MNFMRIGLLVIWAIACLSGSLYSAHLGVILFKDGKKSSSAMLFCLGIAFVVFSIASLIAI